MDAVTIILIVSLVGGVLALIAYPLWQQTRPEAIFRVNHSGQTLEEYQARYQAILDAIKDLMFDYEMGKVSREDYEILLNQTKLEAANLRRQIDHLSSAVVEVDVSLDAEIETLVAQFKNSGINGNEALIREVEAEIELLKDLELDEQADTASAADETLICPNCHQPVRADDAFCSRCGQSLAELAAKIDEDTCPECGYGFQSDDLFCAQCGFAFKEVNQEETTTELPA